MISRHRMALLRCCCVSFRLPHPFWDFRPMDGRMLWGQVGFGPESNEVKNKCEEDGIHLNTCQLTWSTACLYEFTTAGMDYDYINTCHWDLVGRVIHHTISSNPETHRHQEPKVENLRLGWLRCFKNLGGIIPRSRKFVEKGVIFSECQVVSVFIPGK